MKKNKKLTFCGLVLACACLLCACGSRKNNTTYDHTQSTDSLNDSSATESLAPTESTSDGFLGDAIDDAGHTVGDLIDDAGHTVGDLIDDAADGVSNVADDLLEDGDAASRERP